MKWWGFLFLFLVAAPIWADDGAENGGDYEFYYSDADKIISEAQVLAAHILDGWSEEVWSNSYFVKSLDRADLKNIILSAHHNMAKEMVRKNPKGEEEPLAMNWLPDSHAIEVLAGAYRETKLRLQNFENLDDIRTDLARELVHEALHLFHYSEAEAYRVSRFVYGPAYILQCDEITAQLSGYKCVFPTPDRIDHVRSLLNRWAARTKTAQPYVFLLGDWHYGLAQIDISKPVDTWQRAKIKARAANGSFYEYDCHGLDSRLVFGCEVDHQKFAVDLVTAKTVDLNSPGPCHGHEYQCDKQRHSEPESAFAKEMLAKTVQTAILIKRN
jgi:hypothetical protein